MSREILFRGKTEAGAWVYGGIAFQEDGDVVIVGALDKYQSIYDMGMNSEYVIPETVGQFTGVTDKNGTKIFEGDIVRDIYEHIGQTATVEFTTEDIASCGCCVPKFAGSGFKAGSVDITYCEIIGNIHDNPAFLR